MAVHSFQVDKARNAARINYLAATEDAEITGWKDTNSDYRCTIQYDTDLWHTC